MQIARTALFCALVFAATWVSVPAGLGNVNLGDAVILSAAWLLSGPSAVMAAGVGAALADLLAGYALYAPGTLLIKALMVMAALGILRLTRRLPSRLGRILSGITAELVMVGGYFLYESFVLSYGMAAAAVSLPLNALQGGVGILVGELLFCALRRARVGELLEERDGGAPK